MSAILVQNDFNLTCKQHAQINFRIESILLIFVTILSSDQTITHWSDMNIVSNAHAQLDCFLRLISHSLATEDYTTRLAIFQRL